MKHNILYSIPVVAAGMLLATGCSSDKPVLTDKDLANSQVFLDTDEGMSQKIYYKPYVGYVGDPMPFFDPQSNDFKVMYLQDYRPNPITYHPIWCVYLRCGFIRISWRTHSVRQRYRT